MYKIILTSSTRRARSWTIRTDDPLHAENVFREVVSRPYYAGRKGLQVQLIAEGQILMTHRFDRSPGQSQFVHDDDEIRLFPD